MTACGETVFLKLGGSLLTDKTAQEVLQANRVKSICAQIATVLDERPELKLVLGVGSGSFGHFPAFQYGLAQGADHPDAWMGTAITADSAARLVRHVTGCLIKAGVNAWSCQPGSAWMAQGGRVRGGPADVLARALASDLVPVVHGDVMLDLEQRVCIASTEEIFRFLVPSLRPNRILLAGEVPGIMSGPAEQWRETKPISRLQLARSGDLPLVPGASRGVDVTGGMRTKLQLCLEMVEACPEAYVHIFDGRPLGAVQAVLTDPDLQVGTRVVGLDQSR
ncbi:MAG: isopentenyl phosphate kinase [Caldilineaceae bacterium]|nr:isopentenyl phosphate kinase [Caldilineaceae bacterium]